MAYQGPIALNTEFYKCSFSPQTIRDWNALPDSLISSAEGAEDGENPGFPTWVFPGGQYFEPRAGADNPLRTNF